MKILSKMFVQMCNDANIFKYIFLFKIVSKKIETSLAYELFPTISEFVSFEYIHYSSIFCFSVQIFQKIFVQYYFQKFVSKYFPKYIQKNVGFLEPPCACFLPAVISKEKFSSLGSVGQTVMFSSLGSIGQTVMFSSLLSSSLGSVGQTVMNSLCHSAVCCSQVIGTACKQPQHDTTQTVQPLRAGLQLVVIFIETFIRLGPVGKTYENCAI